MVIHSKVTLFGIDWIKNNPQGTNSAIGRLGNHEFNDQFDRFSVSESLPSGTSLICYYS